MIYLLDANTVRYIVKGQSRHARRKLERVSVDHDVSISVMTEAEMRLGLARGKLSAATEAAVELFLSKIDILPWDSAAARAYGLLRAGQERKGRPLSVEDLMIAAHALSLGLTLVTHDGAFSYVDGLKTEDWTVGQS